MADGCPHRCIVSMLQGQGGQVDLRVTERLVWEPGFDTVIEGCGGPRSRSGSTGLCGEESEAAGGAPSPALRACLSREGKEAVAVLICVTNILLPETGYAPEGRQAGAAGASA